MNHRTPDALAALLAAAGAAHGAYETGELHGVYDQQWAQWYAAHLLAHGINALLPAPLTAAQLAGLLTQYDQEHRQRTPPPPWPRYYAARLLGHSEV